MTYNSTALSWVWSTGIRLDDILNGNISWPFVNIPIDAIFDINQILTRSVRKAIFIYGTLISSLGLVLSALSVCVVYKKAVKDKNSFFKSMMIISILDLFFNMGSLLIRTCRDTLSMQGSSSFGLMWLMNILRGVTFTFSLASDLCVLALSVERYLAVKHPHVYHNLSDKKKRRGKIIVFTIITVLGCTRLHYSLSAAVVKAGDFYFYVPSTFESTSYVEGLATFSDMVLPFLLLITMVVVSGKLIRVITKRVKKSGQGKIERTKRSDTRTGRSGINLTDKTNWTGANEFGETDKANWGDKACKTNGADEAYELNKINETVWDNTAYKTDAANTDNISDKADKADKASRAPGLTVKEPNPVQSIGSANLNHNKGRIEADKVDKRTDNTDEDNVDKNSKINRNSKSCAGTPENKLAVNADKNCKINVLSTDKPTRTKSVWIDQPTSDEKTVNAIKLTLILDLLFMANQSAYCVYTVMEVLSAQIALTFESDYPDLIYWCTLQNVFYDVALTTVITECLSHSVNFLFYFLLSRSFRTEFFAFAEKARSKFTELIGVE